MSFGHIYGGVIGVHPSSPTSGKAAATATTFDFKISDDVILVAISIKDEDEALNGTHIDISTRNSTGKIMNDLPDGQCGGISVYFWDGFIPIPENSVLRIVLEGATATTPRIRVNMMKEATIDED